MSYELTTSKLWFSDGPSELIEMVQWDAALLCPGSNSSEESLLSVVSILKIQVPVVRRRRLGDQPRLIQDLDDLFGERSLLKVRKVPLQLVQTADADEDPVIPILNPQRGVVDDPSQRRFEECQIVLLHDGLDDPQRVEGRVLEVSSAVVGALATVHVAVSPFLGNFGGFDLAREQATREGVVNDNVQSVSSASDDELRLNGPG